MAGPERTTADWPCGAGRSEDGFTLVGLMVMLIVMAIFMGVAVESISFQMQREKEAELIFRGKQYVEAIRLFQKKYGRYPMSLKEIWKAKPRVIRKKWKDPITDSYQWGVVFLGQQGRQLRPGGTPVAGGLGSLPTPTPAPTPEPGGDGDDTFGGPGAPGGIGGPGGPGGTGARGPIIGVYSRSKRESIKVYEGRTRYCDWKFVLETAQKGRRGGGNPNTPWGQIPKKPTPGGRPGGPGVGGGPGTGVPIRLRTPPVRRTPGF